MEKYYWTEESWGSNNGDPLPDNIERIINEANAILDAYADSYEDPDEIQEYSNYLWEYYCKHDFLPDTYHRNWTALVELMDDDAREQVHFELAPCIPDKFLDRYLEIDPDFETVLTQFAKDIDH